MSVGLLVISLQGKANGKRGDSSIVVNKYLLPCTNDGNGPFKTIFSRGNGSKTFMSVSSPLVMNFRFK